MHTIGEFFVGNRITVGAHGLELLCQLIGVFDFSQEMRDDLIRTECEDRAAARALGQGVAESAGELHTHEVVTAHSLIDLHRLVAPLERSEDEGLAMLLCQFGKQLTRRAHQCRFNELGQMQERRSGRIAFFDPPHEASLYKSGQ